MKGILLFILSIVLAIFFLSIAFAGCLLIVIFEGRLNSYGKEMAIAVDRFGNVALGPVMNIVIIKQSSKNKFGDSKETISSVLGKNVYYSERKGNGNFGKYQHLTILGDVLVFILSKRHCLDAIGN